MQAFDVWPASEPYLTAFLRLSDGRQYAVGMGGAIPRRIEFAEMESYGRVFGFATSPGRLQGFVEIIGQLDDAFMAHQADPTAVQRVTEPNQE